MRQSIKLPPFSPFMISLTTANTTKSTRVKALILTDMGLHSTTKLMVVYNGGSFTSQIQSNNVKLR